MAVTTADDAALRLRRELWRPEDMSPASSPGAVEYMLIVRGGSMNVLPVQPRSVAASAMLRWTDDASPATAALRLGMWAGIRSGAAHTLLRQRAYVQTGPGSLHEYLANALDVPRVHLTAAFGPPRPNQKPVLRVFDEAGATVAFAKVGWNDLTTQLVSHEAAFLRCAPRPPGARMVMPEVLHLGRWAGRTVALLSVLLGDYSWQAAPAPGLPVLRDVARLGDTYTRSLGGSPFAQRFRSGGDNDLRAAVDEIERRWSQIELPFGRWHGDWTPWNIRTNRDTTVVWDWERTAADIPVGFDALHYEFQCRMAGGAPAALPALLGAAAAVSPTLDGLGVDAAGIPALTCLYAAEMYARFAATADDQRLGVGWVDTLLPDVLRHYRIA